MGLVHRLLSHHLTLDQPCAITSNHVRVALRKMVASGLEVIAILLLSRALTLGVPTTCMSAAIPTISNVSICQIVPLVQALLVVFGTDIHVLRAPLRALAIASRILISAARADNNAKGYQLV